MTVESAQPVLTRILRAPDTAGTAAVLAVVVPSRRVCLCETLRGEAGVPMPYRSSHVPSA